MTSSAVLQAKPVYPNSTYSTTGAAKSPGETAPLSISSSCSATGTAELLLNCSSSPACVYGIPSQLSLPLVSLDFCYCSGINAPLLTRTIGTSTTIDCSYISQPTANVPLGIVTSAGSAPSFTTNNQSAAAESSITKTDSAPQSSITNPFENPSFTATMITGSDVTVLYSQQTFTDLNWLSTPTTITTAIVRTSSGGVAGTSLSPIIVGPSGVYFYGQEQGGGGGGGRGSGGLPCIWPLCDSGDSGGGGGGADPPPKGPEPGQISTGSQASSLSQSTASLQSSSSSNATSSSISTSDECLLPPQVTLPPDSTSIDNSDQPTSVDLKASYSPNSTSIGSSSPTIPLFTVSNSTISSAALTSTTAMSSSSAPPSTSSTSSTPPPPSSTNSHSLSSLTALASPPSFLPISNTPPSATVSPQPPHGPTANCHVSAHDFYFAVNITDISGWAEDGGETLQAALHKEEDGCGALTKWRFSTDSKGVSSASFHLPPILKEGCPGRAIKSAGGPTVLC